MSFISDVHFLSLHQASKECQVLYASLGLVQLFAIWLQLVMLRPLVASLLPLRESVSKLALTCGPGRRESGPLGSAQGWSVCWAHRVVRSWFCTLSCVLRWVLQEQGNNMSSECWFLLRFFASSVSHVNKVNCRNLLAE